jgi:hypothetical protein
MKIEHGRLSSLSSHARRRQRKKSSPLAEEEHVLPPTTIDAGARDLTGLAKSQNPTHKFWLYGSTAYLTNEWRPTRSEIPTGQAEMRLNRNGRSAWCVCSVPWGEIFHLHT